MAYLLTTDGALNAVMVLVVALANIVAWWAANPPRVERRKP